MTPFFRRIRHKLANANKFLMYSRYAVGEIVLVVIGILIALQINECNEISKNDHIEKTFFTDVLDDFEKDRTEMENINGFYDNRIKRKSLEL